MKVVVTARQYDEKSLEYLRHQGCDVEYYENALTMSEEEIYECIKEADAIIVGIEPIRRSLLERLPKLKVVSRRGIGYDSIDVDACEELGITFTRTLGMVEASVAEQTFGYIMYFGRRVDLQSQQLKEGLWLREDQFGVRTRKLGIIGYGGIGKEISKRALAFGMQVLATSHHDDEGEIVDGGVHIVNENTLLRESDYVVITVPLREETYHYANKEMFEKMKPTAYFINIARGGVMNIDDLADAVKNKTIAGCATDVFEVEPCTASPLHDLGDNVILTAHTSPCTHADHIGMNMKAVANTIEALNAKKTLV